MCSFGALASFSNLDSWPCFVVRKLAEVLKDYLYGFSMILIEVANENKLSGKLLVHYIHFRLLELGGNL